MKGRKAIPSKIIDLRGGKSHTHRPERDQEPRPPEKMPRCPKHLNKEARKEWTRAGKILQSIGLMTDLDMAVFAGYCDSYAQWAEATTKLHEEPMVYKKKDGTPGLSPYFRIIKDSFDRMMRAAQLIGLSPSSRATLKVEKPKPKSKAEAFRARKESK